jgi:hypothetical protein
VWGGELAGVVAADLLVASVEARVLPALAGLERTVALTNADGRVIASNSAALAPGQRIPVGKHAARVSSVRSWLLVEPQPAASAAPATSDSSLP